MDQSLTDTLQAHGPAGLFIDPESILVSSSLRHTRSSARKGTAMHHAHLSDQAFVIIAKSLAEGVGVAATARIQGVDKKTVLLVLAKAGEHAAKIDRALMRNLIVSECQLDEMWSFIGKKEKNLEPDEKLRGELGDAWIWIAFDAVNKVAIASVIGKRTQPHAVELLQKVKRVTARMPTLFSSDQLDQYGNALLEVYGTLMTPPRKPGPGRPPNPRLVPPDDLLYVQVVKEYKKSRVVKVTRKVVFGDPDRVSAILESSSVSSAINTSYIERYNGTVRHIDARCTRKTLRFSKCKDNHVRQLALSFAYYHLCLPHRSLSKQYGQPTTPIMAAGLTDHVWTMGELLTSRDENLRSQS
ncbi:MAG: IS1 family transposase [Candidatus Eisenbacteria sp.]|nr:IS1 family transposase [Candidatus Eisenbacteria bacterium]